MPPPRTTTTCAGCGNAIPPALVGDAFCVACRYGDAPPVKPWHSAAVDGDGNILETDIAAPPVDGEPDAANTNTASNGDFAEMLAVFLAWQIAGGDVETAGRRAWTVAHLAGKSGCETDAELAAKLNISPGRISQLRAEIQANFGTFGKCNGRVA
jgi:hypothetical protein